MSETTLWPDPEPVDQIEHLPPTTEHTSLAAALDELGDPDHAFGAGAGAGEQAASPDDEPDPDADPELTLGA